MAQGTTTRTDLKEVREQNGNLKPWLWAVGVVVALVIGMALGVIFTTQYTQARAEHFFCIRLSSVPRFSDESKVPTLPLTVDKNGNWLRPGSLAPPGGAMTLPIPLDVYHLP
jgi:hypothetical protein